MIQFAIWRKHRVCYTTLRDSTFVDNLDMFPFPSRSDAVVVSALFSNVYSFLPGLFKTEFDTQNTEYQQCISEGCGSWLVESESECVCVCLIGLL